MENRFISKLRAFGDLTDEGVLAPQAATSRPKRYSSKHDLIREGDRPGPVFVMLEGWACRYKILPSGLRQIVAYLMPGDCCDLHVGLIAEMDHSIQTVTASVVAQIDRTTMDEILDHHASIAKALYVSQLIDEGTMRAWITSIGRRSSIERVAHLMCELYLRARNIGIASGAPFDLPLSQLMLADSLGMTPVHLNRVVKQLRAAGAMAMGKGSLTISDPVMLSQIAGFDENYLHRRLRPTR